VGLIFMLPLFPYFFGNERRRKIRAKGVRRNHQKKPFNYWAGQKRGKVERIEWG